MTVLLIALAILSPPLLSRLRDSLSLSGIRTEEIPQASGSSQPLTTLEKLTLYCRSLQTSDSVLTTTTQVCAAMDFPLDHLDSNIGSLHWFQLFQTELQTLLEQNIFPRSLLPEASEKQGYLTVELAERTVYTDVSDFSRSFSLYHCAFQFLNRSYTIVLEPEGQKLWFLWMSVDYDDDMEGVVFPDEYDSQAALTAFGEYLGLPSPISIVTGLEGDSLQTGLAEGIQWELDYSEDQQYFSLFFNPG